MHDELWKAVTDALRDKDNVARAVAGARTLHETATREDLPRLMELLSDDDFFVREAAAWPLSELAGPAALPELLQALQRGFDEGHDNDGFQAALADLVEANKTEAQEVLARLVNSPDRSMRENAAWLLAYCE